MPASRAKPIAFGIVHGCSGWSERVARGGGPERSSPNRRRFVSGLSAPPAWSGQLLPQRGDRVGRAVQRDRTRLAAAADLGLELARLEPAAAHGDP
jgi:hypothetical protein